MLLHSIPQARPAPALTPIATPGHDARTAWELPIAAIGLPMRSLNAMHAAGIRTLADTADWSLRDLQALPQVGPSALETLQQALRQINLSLRPSVRRRRLW